MRKTFKIIILSLLSFVVLLFFTIAIYPSPRLNHPYQVVIKTEDNYSYSLINENFSNYVRLDKISEPLIKTLITIEDKNFYTHSGLDYKRILSSTIHNIEANEIVEGASTITQQLSRLAFLDNSKSFNRKLKEALYSKKIEAKYSKEIILEMYLNLVYFGHDIYGIGAACSYYFDVLPSQVDYSMASILVGIINSPNKYAPDINLDLCLKKQKQVLNILYKNGILDDENFKYFSSKEITFNNKKDESNYNFMFYYDAIKKELINSKIYTSQKLREGIIIDSYMNNQIQNKTNKTIEKYSSKLNKEELAVVVMKPYSSQVLSLVGGTSYIETEFNRAIDSKRQIGSTIKPLIYYLALENGFTPNTEFISEKTTFHIDNVGDYSPKNAGEKYANRKISMLEAISLSDNIYSMKTSLYLGLSKIKSFLSSFNIDVASIDSTVGLGTLELSPLELCSIYNAFASEGVYYAPSLIKNVKNQSNVTLKKYSVKRKKVMNKDNTVICNYMLRSPFDRAFLSYTSPSLINYKPNATFSAKTGTTNSSTWVVGFNKKYTICVYLGTDDNSYLSNTKIAKSIFQDLANSLCETEVEFYSIPASCEKFSLTNKLNNIVSYNYIRKK